MDNIVRELSLAGAAASNPSAPLAPVIETVVNQFSDARNAIKRQALAAAARGEDRLLLVLGLPESAADAGEAYLAALDEADEYSRGRSAPHAGDRARPPPFLPLVRPGGRPADSRAGARTATAPAAACSSS